MLASAPEPTPARVSASTARSPNTIDASPRGPNQPTKATVGRPSRLPTSAIVTGTMRMTVRLRMAYRIGRRSSVIWNSELTKEAPKTVHTAIDKRIPAASLNSSAGFLGRCVAAPKASPATKAATNPLPPSATDAK